VVKIRHDSCPKLIEQYKVRGARVGASYSSLGFKNEELTSLPARLFALWRMLSKGTSLTMLAVLCQLVEYCN